MADGPLPGRGLATRRAIGDVVRRAALDSYGVVSVSGPRPWHTALAWIGRATPGVKVRVGPPLTVDLYLAVASGVPVAEVARNVDSAVRYGLRLAFDRELDELAIHVDRLRTPVSRSTDSGGSDDRPHDVVEQAADAPPSEAGPEAA
ncbi:MAG: Asp23/Gls24 family envelope stress response protein [Candidatus Limnocylindrales bacterium]